MLQDGTFVYPIPPQLLHKLFKLLKAVELAIEHTAEELQTPKSILRALRPCRVCCIFDSGFDPFTDTLKQPFNIHIVLTDQGVQKRTNELMTYFVRDSLNAREALLKVYSEVPSVFNCRPFPPESFALPVPGHLLEDWRLRERMQALQPIANEYVIFEQDRLRQLRETPKIYDVCLSFAADAREFVDEVAMHLSQAELDVFYDKFLQTEIWGEDLFKYLEDIYQERSRFCVIFVSKQYVERRWPQRELRSALEREARLPDKYILPIMLHEGVEVAGLQLSSRSWINGTQLGPQSVADLIVRKVRGR
jgi:TIR domain